MTYIIVGIIILLLVLLGEPVFVLIGAGGLLLFKLSGTDTSAVIVELYRLASLPALIAIPLFTFAGYILAESNAPKRLVRLALAFFGWMPGGLAIVSLVSTAIFTAFTGASGVTIVALGGLLFPILVKESYPERFSLGLMTTSGSLGLLFPPSLPIILYGIVAGISVDKLFAAGVIPGILLIILLSLFSIYTGVRSGVRRQSFSAREALGALKEAAWEIPLPIIIIGGIYAGLFTATEASAIMAFYVFVVEVFILRDVKLFKDLPRIVKKSMMLVGAIFVVLGTALGLTSYLIDEQIPMQLFQLIHQFVSSQLTFLVLLNIFLLVINMVEIFSAIIIVVPLIVPIAAQYGIDPVHLGVIFLLNLEIGYMLPPLGLNLFISSLRFEKDIVKIYRAVLPFLGIALLALLIVTYLPDLSLYLTRIMKVQ
ncbi:MAG TPA: TRAP transporter large permease [Candidatus Acidoferrales bacterium]|nr:TRAP transporter large permease [Candidatus Acidoferrales bacterium]